jgi:cobalamin-dependent methionine synthase I
MFHIIGERINTSRKKVREAVDGRDAAYIQADVIRQQEAGASYIDINAGARIGHEREDMQWLMEVVQEVSTVPLCLDSPDPDILATAYDRVKMPPMINSISLEKNRFETMRAFLRGKDCHVVALCMDDSGMPKNSQDIFERAKKLVEGLEETGIGRSAIFIDPMAQPVSVDTQNGVMAFEAVEKIMSDLPGVHTIAGISNASYGLPERKMINRTYLGLMMAHGLDAAVLDPLDRKIMSVVYTADMLLGKDEFCDNYLSRVRSGIIIA